VKVPTGASFREFKAKLVEYLDREATPRPLGASAVGPRAVVALWARIPQVSGPSASLTQGSEREESLLRRVPSV
jgi:hypothetical protein